MKNNVKIHLDFLTNSFVSAIESFAFFFWSLLFSFEHVSICLNVSYNRIIDYRLSFAGTTLRKRLMDAFLKTLFQVGLVMLWLFGSI